MDNIFCLSCNYRQNGILISYKIRKITSKSEPFVKFSRLTKGAKFCFFEIFQRNFIFPSLYKVFFKTIV